MTPNDLTFYDWIMFLGSIASGILALLAIWLSVWFYLKTKEAEKENASLLTQIKTQTQLINRYTAKMLDKYVTYSTTPQPTQHIEEVFLRVLEINQGLVGGQKSFHDQDVLKELTALYIATAYHSGISNVLLQQYVSEDINTLDEGVKSLLSSSKNDYDVSIRWINDYGTDYIETVPAKYYYQVMQDENFEQIVLDPIEAVQQKAQQV